MTEITPEIRAQAVELMHAGKGRNEIARELSIAGATVTDIASAEGHFFPSVQTIAATEARRATAAERRRQMLHRVLDQADRILDTLEADTFKTLIPVGFGAVEATELDFIPSAELRNLSQALNVLLERAARMDEAGGTEELDRAKSLLGSLFLKLEVIDD